MSLEPCGDAGHAAAAAFRQGTSERDYRRVSLGLTALSSLLFAVSGMAQNEPAVPPVKPLEVPPRIGVFGTAKLGINEVIQRVLANDRDLAVSRILREEARYNVTGARGYYDPRLGLNTYRQHSVTPIASLIGGAANGELTQEQLLADPQLSGASWFGGTYKLDFSSARQTSNSSFLSLNPQYPSSLNLNLTQPLWRGLFYDDNRHRMQVAKGNVRLTDAQFRQRVIEVVTQAVEAYWELDFAYRNLEVQIEAVRLAEQQDASNRRQVEQGLLAPIDVVATQTQVATFQQNVFTAQQALTTAENAVKVLMLPDRTDLMWSMALTPEQAQESGENLPTLDDAVKTALAKRPELAGERHFDRTESIRHAPQPGAIQASSGCLRDIEPRQVWPAAPCPRVRTL